MSDEIEKVFRKLYSLVLKPEVVDEATPYKLIKINVSDKNIQKEYMKTNIGTAATNDFRDNYIKSDMDMFKKHRQGCEHLYSQLLFCHQICFYHLLEKLDMFF